MKNIFGHGVTVMGMLCLLTSPTFAQSQMRDYSLSPGESVQQPNVSHAQSNTGGVAPLGSASSTQFNPYSSPLNRPNLVYNPNPQTPANSFMTGYCDPNFHPLVMTGNMQTCFQAAQQQVCQQFQQLPADVQTALDTATACVYNAANGDASATENCSAYDTNRLQLLKKYWQDQNTSYAILFLPDEVLNGPAKCMRGGR